MNNYNVFIHTGISLWNSPHMIKLLLLLMLVMAIGLTSHIFSLFTFSLTLRSKLLHIHTYRYWYILGAINNFHFSLVRTYMVLQILKDFTIYLYWQTIKIVKMELVSLKDKILITSIYTYLKDISNDANHNQRGLGL